MLRTPLLRHPRIPFKANDLYRRREAIVSDWRNHASEAHGYPADSAAVAMRMCEDCRSLLQAMRESEQWT